MKTILCYGDSNTWGFIAGGQGRFPANVRWTGVMKQMLGEEYYVIEEGLNGRTTVWEDPLEDYRNGREYLIPCIRSHKPVDLVIIMLGTNDLKKRFSLPACDIAAGAGILADIVLKSGAGHDGQSPRVLLVSPIEVHENIKESEFGEAFGGESSVETSRKFAYYFKRVSEQYGCEFMDAASIAAPSPVDAIHMEAGEHKKLGEAIGQRVKEILT